MEEKEKKGNSERGIKQAGSQSEQSHQVYQRSCSPGKRHYNTPSENSPGLTEAVY